MAPNLRYRLRFEERGPHDDYNDSDPDWIKVGDDWGRIEELNGRELNNAQAIDEKVTAKIVTRYHEQLRRRSDMRIVEYANPENRIWNIAAIVVDPEKRMQTFMVSRSTF